MNISHMFAIAACAAGTMLPQGSRDISPETSQPTVTMTLTDVPVLKAIGRIAQATHVPLGIIVGEDQMKLCRLKVNLSLSEQSAEGAINQVLAGTGYLSSKDGVVLNIRAADITPLEQSVLDYRFPELRGHADTYLGREGAYLNGAIAMQVKHFKGYAAATPHSSNAEKLTMPTMWNTSVQEIANKLVTLGGQGFWIFTSNHQNGLDDDSFSFYSYRDDTLTIPNAKCD